MGYLSISPVLGKVAKPFYVHPAKDFGIVTLGKFCDKIGG